MHTYIPLTLLALLAGVQADFKILSRIETVPGIDGPTDGPGSTSADSLIACPSNYLNCNCYRDGDRQQRIQNHESLDLPGSGYMRLPSGLCGLGALDFYRGGDGSWQIYVAGGDGSSQGTCYPESGGITQCDGFNYFNTVQSVLNCVSYICN